MGNDEIHTGEYPQCTGAIVQVILIPVLPHELVLREMPDQRASSAPHTTAVQLLLPQALQKKIEYFS